MLNILVDEENKDKNNLDEIQEFIEQQRPTNTNKKTTYHLNVWKRYCDIVHESRKLEEIPTNELNIMNWKFLLILRTKINTLFTGLAQLELNCAIGLENVFKTLGTSPYLDLAAGK